MYENTTERKRIARYPLEFKAKVVATAIKENLDEYQISERFGISITAASNWMWSKNWILESYCERQRLKENPNGPIIVHGKEADYELVLEDEVPRRINAEDAIKELRATKRKARYLEDKIAYYEALMEVLELKPTEVQKKSAMRRLEEHPRPEAGETQEDSVQ